MSEEKSAEDVKNDANIEIWKIKKLIKSLEMARGCAAAPKNPPGSPLANVGCGGRRLSAWHRPAPPSDRTRLSGVRCAARHGYGTRCHPTARPGTDPACCVWCGSNGTSMISLILPPKDQISRAAKMLADEFGTASNIKSRVNRLSVLSAITSTQQRLKLFSKVPPN